MEGSCHLRRFLHGAERLNPLRWSTRTVKVVTAGFFMIFLPLYFFFGFQPVNEVDAANYPELRIPSIELQAPVKPVAVHERQLEVPDTIAGSYSSHNNKTLLVGHSSTIFKNLHEVENGSLIIYNNHNYRVTKVETYPKTDISMSKILADAEVDTIIIMTCAGEPLPNQDATHRLLITAEIAE